MERNRGQYNPALHRISNNFGIHVAHMFKRKYDADIKKVIVNSNQVCKEKNLVPEDYKWDVVLTVNRDNLPEHLKQIVHGKSIVGLAIEIEAKMVKEKFIHGDVFWPSMFGTADFGWVKYRDPKNPVEFKKDVKDALALPGVQILHFLCLYWEDGNTIRDNYKGDQIAWVMNFSELDKQRVDTKGTSRGGPPEKFYMVNTNCKDMICLNLTNGELAR